MKLFLAPHNDDETLFGAFTIMREQPRVVIVYDSIVQAQRGLPIEVHERRHESCMAHMQLLPNYDTRIDFLGLSDEGAEMKPVEEALSPYLSEQVEAVWAPAWRDTGNRHHNLVGVVARNFWPGITTDYLTYVIGHKDRDGVEVPFDLDMIPRKHRALACYTSQIVNAKAMCYPHFVEDLKEYYLDAR